MSYAICVAAALHSPNVTAQPAPPRAEDRSEALLLDVTVNGVALSGVIRVDRLPDGTFALPEEAWTDADLLPTGSPVILPDGRRGYRLDEGAGFRHDLDRPNMTLAVHAPPEAFRRRSHAVRQNRTADPRPSPPGGYVNYDVTLTQSDDGSTHYGGGLEAVVFNGWGSFVSSATLRGTQDSVSLRRNQTFWRKDLPGEMRTLVVGDTVSSSGGWSRPVRYAGIRYARDFALAPGYITYPMPSLDGSAALPSTIEVLINNERRRHLDVAPGPFEVTDLPVISGAGEINLVVRDLSGTARVITQDYYFSPDLLAPGLSDFSLELGSFRRRYGMRSNDYGDAFAAGSYRYGVSTSLTVAGRVELERDRQALGTEVMAVLGQLGLVRATAAWSHGGNGNGQARAGGHYSLAFERNAPWGGASIRWEHFDRGFARFGASPRETRPKDRWQGGVNLALAAGLSAGAVYVRQTSWNAERFSLASANLSASLPGNLYLNAHYSRRLDDEGGWTAGISLVKPLGGRRTATVTAARDTGGGTATAVSVRQTPPIGPGWGWHMRVADEDPHILRAGAVLNTNAAQFLGEVNVGTNRGAIRLGASGSVGWLKGLAFASRRIDEDAFAVVRVADIAGVPIYRENQVAAVTNEDGLALVTNLHPYETNRLTVDPLELPLDIDIRGLRESVVPYARSGVFVDFSIERSRNALVVLTRQDGRPVPVGARVDLRGQSFMVGRNGEAYLMKLKAENRVTVTWKSGSCTAFVLLDKDMEPEPKLGPLPCRSIK
jgi:outer membrane usher protein